MIVNVSSLLTVGQSGGEAPPKSRRGCSDAARTRRRTDSEASTPKDDSSSSRVSSQFNRHPCLCLLALRTEEERRTTWERLFFILFCFVTYQVPLLNAHPRFQTCLSRVSIHLNLAFIPHKGNQTEIGQYPRVEDPRSAYRTFLTFIDNQ